MREKLLLATNNKGKMQEYRDLLQDVNYDLVSPEEVGVSAEVPETGETYEENARLKAETLAEASGLTTIADDSGLEVDALNGEPGIRSARYAGEDASDRDRVNYLLSKLEGVPEEKRTARFVCVIALARPGDCTEYFIGERKGFITGAPRGENGFGYDPVFYLPEYGKTMAELPGDLKNRLSHRGQAAAKLARALGKTGKKSAECG